MMRCIKVQLATTIIVSLFFFPPCTQSPNPLSNPPKAAIVDQLYSLQPKGAFISEVTQKLEGYGFKVDIYHGDDITVDFYRQLPSYGYKLTIFRAHSGLLGSKGKTIKRTCLFTTDSGAA